MLYLKCVPIIKIIILMNKLLFKISMKNRYYINYAYTLNYIIDQYLKMTI